MPTDAECATLAVLEDPSRPGGRRIRLRLARLAALAGPSAQAIFIFQGGPGQAATKLADFYARTYAAARKSHAIVLIDQRGTGGSNALACDFGGTADMPQRALADLFDPGVIRDCRRSLETHADLTQYTTAAAVRDAEAVREALGYATIDLYGTSYGTRVAMEYARRHPRRVRTLTLKGVLAPASIAPADFAADVERSVRLMLRDCAGEPDCTAAFPRLGDDLKAVLQRLEAVPARVALPGGATVVLTRGMFGAVLRTMLQATSLRAELPALVHAAAGGRWLPYVGKAMELRKAAQAELATGLMLSVLCTEDVPYLDQARARDAARGTVLGTYWLDQASAACALWPHGRVPADWRAPFKLSAPALLVSGALDPATPPSAAEAARAHLVQSRHIVVPGGSHSFSGMSGCIDLAMSAFVITGRLDAVDADCAATIRAPPFKPGADKMPMN